MHDIGKVLIIIGILFVITGIIYYQGWGPAVFGWMGRLPGDIRVENENSRFYFPVATCIVLSLLATLIIWLVIWIRSPH